MCFCRIKLLVYNLTNTLVAFILTGNTLTFTDIKLISIKKLFICRGLKAICQQYALMLIFS